MRKAHAHTYLNYQHLSIPISNLIECYSPMANYAAMGARGLSQSADSMRRKGIDKFNLFLNSKDMPSWDELPSDQLTIDLLQQFGTFLCHHLMKEDGSSYSLGSIEKYLSGVTNSAQEDSRFKNLEIWKDKNWYTRLRSAINKTVVLKCIEEGRPLSEKGAPIGRDLLFRICDYYFQLNDKDIFLRRFVLVTTFLAVGRTGEIGISNKRINLIIRCHVGDASWNGSYWDYDLECPFIYWNERKVAKQSMLNFFPDAMCFQCDWFHALGCYLLFGGGSAAYLRQPESNWVVPEFANCEPEAISRAINRWLRELVGKVRGITENVR